MGDFRPFQYLVFDEKGDWVKSVKPDPMEMNSPRSMHILADGRLFNGRSNGFDKLPNFAPRTMVMELYDANGKLTDTVVTLENGRYGLLDDDPQSPYVYPIFESFAQARSRGDRIVIGHASKPELRLQRVDPGMPLDRIIRWDVGSREITTADVAAFKAAQVAQYADMPAESKARFLDPLISTNRPVADSFPAFGRSCWRTTVGSGSASFRVRLTPPRITGSRSRATARFTAGSTRRALRNISIGVGTTCWSPTRTRPATLSGCACFRFGCRRPRGRHEWEVTAISRRFRRIRCGC